MIYVAHADTKIVVGGWPQFFKSVFHVYANSEADAIKQADLALNEAQVTYEKLRVELIGRRYEVTDNEEFSLVGIKYPAGSVKEIRIYEGTMQICIDNIRHGKLDHDNIGVWCRPADFKADVIDYVFPKIKCKEV